MGNKTQHEKGFTLIEIIASISVIVLVLMVFLPLFPQTVSWTKNAERELVSGNLLARVAHDVKAHAELLPLGSVTPGDARTVRTSDIPAFPAYGQAVDLVISIDAATNLYVVHIKTLKPDDKTDAASFVYVDGGGS